MSNATQNSRQSGDSQRRRSRGGRNRNNNQHDNRRSGDRESRESRSSGRSEEFRPQSPRSSRNVPPVKLSWWKKFLKAIGLYKEPKPPARGERKPEAARPQGEARPAKSNIRNARTQEGSPGEKPEGGPAPRGNRGGERTRGGDRSTVESPRVYVGNLSYDVSEQDLQELFKGIGGVRNVEIVYNRSTHRSKGYGFVEMLHMDEAIRAVEVLHDQPFMGRKLTVSGAKSKGQDEREDREERPERASRPVVVAPRPAPAAVALKVEDSSEEPVIQTIVETVTETPVEEAPVATIAEEVPVATIAEEAPVATTAEETPVATIAEETPEQVAVKSEVA
jgi:hypothetical protein